MSSRQRFHQIILYCFYFLFGFLPLVFSPISDELFEFPKILCLYAVTIVIASAWVLLMIQERRILYRRTVFDLPIGLFFASQLLSTIFSINPHTSLYGYYGRFNGGLFSVISYLLLFAAFIQFIRKDDLKKMLRAFFVGAILTSLYAFPEHFGASPSCLIISGRFDVNCWVQDVQSRIYGTLGQPNWLAAYMVVLLPLTAVKVVETFQALLGKEEKSQKILKFGTWNLVFLLFTSVLLFTKSRSGIAGGGLALLLFAIFSCFHLFQVKIKNLSLISLPLVSFFLLLVIIGNPIRDRFIPQSLATNQQPSPSGTQLDSGGSESGDIRKVVWIGALAVWKRYPIFGSGVETFGYSYFRDRPVEHNMLSEWEFLYNKAHNEFLNYLATTGLVGFAAYVFLYGSFIIVPLYWGFKTKDSTVGYWLLAVGCSLSGLAVSNFFGFSTAIPSLLSFLLPALAVVLVQKDRENVTVKAKHDLTTWVVGGLILAVTIFLLLSVANIFRADLSYARGKVALRSGDIENAFEHLHVSTETFASEPTYHDELGYVSAKAAMQLAQVGDATGAAQFAAFAIDQSDKAIQANHVSTSFFKTRARILILLAAIDEQLYEDALQTLQAAWDLSPTDPKIPYYLSIIANAQGKPDEEKKYLETAIKLRPIDVNMHLALATWYEENKDPANAIKQYKYVLESLDPNNLIAKNKIASLSAIKQ